MMDDLHPNYFQSNDLSSLGENLEEPKAVYRALHAEDVELLLRAAGLEHLTISRSKLQNFAELESFASDLWFARGHYHNRRVHKGRCRPMTGTVAYALGFGRKRHSPFESLVKRLMSLYRKHLEIEPTLSGKAPNTAFICFVDEFLKRCNIMLEVKGKEPRRYPREAIRRAMSFAREARQTSSACQN